METHWWGLRFDDPDVERAYRQWHLDRSIVPARIALIAGLTVWLVGGAGIASISSDGRASFIRIVALMTVVIGAAVVLTYVPTARRWVPAASAGANAAAGLVTVYAMSTLDVPEVAAPITLAAFFAFTVFRLHPLPAAAAVVSYLVAHQVVLTTNHREGELSDATFAIASMMPIASLVAGLMVSIVLERQARDTFTNERTIEKQQRVIASERDRAESLLLNILPPPIAARLQAQPGVIADSFEDVTVLFADVVGFTPMSARVPAEETVRLLNEVFTAFDALAERFGVEKIKTIGDAYMAVAGIPEPRTDHARTMADFAIAVRDAAFDLGVTVRIGLATGPAVAGVIGTHKFAYDLWGDTVNTASRMESHGLPGEIQVSESTYRALDGDFVLAERGPLTIKGKGEMATWLLKGCR